MAEFRTDKDVTPDYVNKKLESMMSAIFDTLGETEERIKEVERQIIELKLGINTDGTQG